MFIVAKRLDGSLGTKVGLNPGDSVLDGDPAPLPTKGVEPLPTFRPIFGRPFLKRFALCYRSVVCPVCPVCLSVCLSVTFVHCGQMVERIMQVGLGPGHIVLRVDPAPPPPKGHSPQFSAHICCGQTAACIKMPLGMV